MIHSFSFSLLIALLLSTGALTQQAGLQEDRILELGDTRLEDAKTAYEEARSKSSVATYVDAGFKLEEARIKFIVLQEIGSPEKQKIAGDRLRAVNQLGKLIHDGKVAISGAPADAPAAGSPEKAPDARPLDAPTTVPAVDVTKRAPVPDIGRQKQSEKLLKDLFKDQYAKKAPEDRLALARTLIEQAGRFSDDPTSQWVVYREAQDLAAQTGDARLALSAIEAGARIFDVDVVTLKSSALSVVGKNAKTPADFAALADAYLRLTDEVVTADQYDAADKSVGSALQFAKRANDPGMIARATGRGKEVSEAKAKFQALKGVLETLAKTPDDPPANGDMGQYTCFVKGNWDLGIRFLAKGPASPMTTLAAKESAMPIEPADQVGLADGWWDLGDKEKSSLRKTQFFAHAAQLYLAASASATGLLKAKIEKRLAEYDKLGDRALTLSGTIDLLALVDLEKDTAAGTWTKTPRGITNAAPITRSAFQIPLIPPAEYDITMVVERTEIAEALIIGLFHGSSQFLAVLDGWGGGVSGLCLLDGKWANDQESPYRGTVIRKGAASTILCSVRKDGVKVMVDGKKVIEWKGDYSRLTLSPEQAVSNPQILFLACMKTRYLISKMQLTSVSGEPKRLR